MMTDEDRAYCAAQWASGIRQKDIARQFGYKTGTTICTTIAYFLLEYAESERDLPPRIRAKHAVARFVQQRNALLGVIEGLR